jgi:hypothetical protein
MINGDGDHLLFASQGTADIVLARHRSENRLVPLLRFAGTAGVGYTVELSTSDVVSLFESLQTMFGADAEQVAEWWRQVTAHSPSGTTTSAGIGT